jgi:hypothetical protein
LVMCRTPPIRLGASAVNSPISAKAANPARLAARNSGAGSGMRKPGKRSSRRAVRSTVSGTNHRASSATASTPR